MIVKNVISNFLYSMPIISGTGKTESVKALGGLFGRQVLVFNCDEGIDVKSMGRIFIGLIKCGAW